MFYTLAVNTKTPIYESAKKVFLVRLMEKSMVHHTRVMAKVNLNNVAVLLIAISFAIYAKSLLSNKGLKDANLVRRLYSVRNGMILSCSCLALGECSA
jgi:hypothetical protein